MAAVAVPIAGANTIAGYTVTTPFVTTDQFTFSFPYLDQSDFRIEVASETILDQADYVFTSDYLIQLTTVGRDRLNAIYTTSGVDLPFIIYRATELQNRTVDFQNGANLTDTDLDLDSTQAFYLIQEAYDTFLIGNLAFNPVDGNIDAGGAQIINLGDTTQLTGATNLTTVLNNVVTPDYAENGIYREGRMVFNAAGDLIRANKDVEPAPAVLDVADWDDVLTAAQLAQITTNTSDITTNVTNIGTNTTNIGTNTTNIGTNTSDIATNAAAITSANATDIFTARINEAGGMVKGDVVYINGATGNQMEASKAINSDFTKVDAIAIATEAGSDNSTISFIHFGELTGLDTSAWSEGDKLYLSNVSGVLTNVHPTGIEAVMDIGVVIRSHASLGIIFININEHTIVDSYDGIMRNSSVNTSSGTGASVTNTLVNDAGYQASFSLTGSNYTGVPNTATLYTLGYGNLNFYIDGNKDFQWVSDTTDSHNFSATVKMTLTADGILSLDGTTGAFKPPTLTTVQRDALTAVEGFQIYNSDTIQMENYVNGAWTAMGSGGGGGGLDTFFTDDHETNGIDNHTTGNNATFDNGGTLDGTLSLDTSTRLNGSQGLKYVMSTASTDDFIASESITIGEKHQENEIGFEFYYKYDGADDDIRFVIYDATNNVELTSSVVYLKASSSSKRFSAQALIPNGVTAIKYGFQVVTGNDTKILLVDDVTGTSSPYVVKDLVQMTEWQSYTPSSTNGFGTPTINSARYRRVGDSIELQIDITTGTVAAAEGRIDLPSGLAFDSSIPTDTLIGRGDRSDSGNTTLVLATAGDTFITFCNDASGTITAENGNNVSGSTTVNKFVATGKIEGWSASTESVLAYNSKTASNSMVRLHTSNGYGTTNTHIRRFNTTVTDTGNAIDYVDSVTDGAEFTIREKGIYMISYTDSTGTSNTYFGISLNSTQLTTSAQSVNVGDMLALDSEATATAAVHVSWSGILEINDVIRAHGNTGNGSTNYGHFTIAKIGVGDLLGVPKPIIGYLKDVKASGTNAGLVSAGVIYTRELNTTSGDFDKFGSLDSDQFTLSKGTYSIDALVPSYRVAQTQAFLYNVTDGVYTIDGSSQYTDGTYGFAMLHVTGRFTIDSTKVFEIRHWSAGTKGTNGLGIAVGSGTNPQSGELYTSVKISKII